MSSVSYDGNRLIPAPFVSVTKNYDRTADGEIIGSRFQLTITGTVVAFKGSPNSSRVFHTAGGYPADEVIAANARLGAIFRKQEAIRELFTNEGRSMEFQSADGSQPMKCNPRIVGPIEFSSDIWYDRCEYTITLECDELSVNGVAQGEDGFPEYILSASETWSIETAEDQPEGLGSNRTYRLTHQLAATGKRFFDETGTLARPAWENARLWVLPRLGFDTDIALSSGVNSLPTYYQGLNHVRGETVGESTGEYSVTETWIMASGTALEDFTINTRSDQDSGLTNVAIEGNIKGLETRDGNFIITSNKYDNALTKFAAASGLALSRAQSYSGVTLNISPQSTTIGRNPITGTITYSYDYNNRPSNLLTSAKSESVTLGESFNVDVFASVGVLGRAVGPVLQGLGSKQALTRNLSIEAVYGAEYIGSGDATSRLITKHPRVDATRYAEIQSLVNSANPLLSGATNNIGGAVTTAYVSNQTDNWDATNGRYSLQIEWTYE
jgi:hypothetical protein